ncbi:MAG: ABC transporter ATP-binding protein [Chloroflexota bacterium]|nr:MAG: ABC transporter ATP-binding protein [Chloroflexota bacterium]
MITLQEVTKTYSLGKGSSVTAVREVSLEIQPCEFVIVVGRSGSGKTTLLNLVGALTRPTSGSVMLDGVNLWELTDPQQSLLRSQKMGFAFQFPSLLPTLTALENVRLPSIFGKKQDSSAIEDRAVQLMQKVGLEDKLSSYPRQLSAGQQQRVVIARALMNQPEVLLADEPTSNLDEKTELEIMELFRDLHRNMGITMVMVTHTRQLISYGTRAIEMANGQIIKNGS